MKLLIITQKVDKNDDVLGFFHKWLMQFASKCESLTVICLYEGEHNLSGNAKVLSLGKEDQVSKITYVFNLYKYIISERKNYDAVFVHMNQIYVVIAGWLFKLLKKKIYLWYAHGSTSLSLRLAISFCTKVFTSTITGLRVNTPKKVITGQGIPVADFSVERNYNVDGIDLITVSRISEVKQIHKMIEVVERLRSVGRHSTLTILGDAITKKDRKYLSSLKTMVVEKDLEQQINFVGSVINDEIVLYLKQATLFLNLSNTGSLDKAILEAMATGLTVLTSNEALVSLIDDKYITSDDITDVTNHVLSLEKNDSSDLVKYVRENHSLDGLVKKLISEME